MPIARFPVNQVGWEGEVPVWWGPTEQVFEHI